jgi:hypothetical protein
MADLEHAQVILEFSNDLEGFLVVVDVQSEDKTVFCSCDIDHEIRYLRRR